MPYINGRKVLGAVRTKYLNVDDVYPIGAVYISFDSTSPASLFGGTWERLNNAFLYATNNDNNIGDTGGEATHILTENEMPSHSHNGLYQYTTGPFKWGNGSVDGFSIDYDNTNKAGSPISTGSTGGGQAHNNMPPYIKVAIWKRTA